MTDAFGCILQLKKKKSIYFFPSSHCLLAGLEPKPSLFSETLVQAATTVN